MGSGRAGVEEAKEGGRLLKAHGLEFDKAYTSLLKRAIKTCYLVLEEVRGREARDGGDAPTQPRLKPPNTHAPPNSPPVLADAPPLRSYRWT
jgi:bisphosphoglycerate-dependent phosphoglycerate mutase